MAPRALDKCIALYTCYLGCRLSRACAKYGLLLQGLSLFEGHNNSFLVIILFNIEVTMCYFLACLTVKRWHFMKTKQVKWQVMHAHFSMYTGMGINIAYTKSHLFLLSTFHCRFVHMLEGVWFVQWLSLEIRTTFVVFANHWLSSPNSCEKCVIAYGTSM